MSFDNEDDETRRKMEALRRDPSYAAARVDAQRSGADPTDYDPYDPNGDERTDPEGRIEAAPDEARVYVPPVTIPPRRVRDTLKLQNKVELAPGVVDFRKMATQPRMRNDAAGSPAGGPAGSANTASSHADASPPSSQSPPRAAASEATTAGMWPVDDGQVLPVNLLAPTPAPSDTTHPSSAPPPVVPMTLSPSRADATVETRPRKGRALWFAAGGAFALGFVLVLVRAATSTAPTGPENTGNAAATMSVGAATPSAAPTVAEAATAPTGGVEAVSASSSATPPSPVVTTQTVLRSPTSPSAKRPPANAPKPSSTWQDIF